jgi:hypothetical protein
MARFSSYAALAVTVATGVISFTVHAQSTKPERNEVRAWKVDDRPITTIPNELSNGDVLLRVRDVLRRRDGSVVAANGSNQRIYFLTSDGTLITGVGRNGAGPGEFGNVVSLDAGEDGSILAYDGQRRTLSEFSNMGKIGESHSLEEWGFKLPREKSVQLTPMGYETFVLAVNEPPVMVPGKVFRPPMTLYRITKKAPVLLGRFPMTEQYHTKSRNTLLMPYGKELLVAQSSTHTFIGDTGSDTILVWGVDGRKLGTIRLQIQPRRFTQSELTQIQDSLVKNAKNKPGGAQAEAAYREVPFPSTAPAFKTLIADREGLLWIKEFTWPKPTSSWLVVDAASRVHAKVLLPNGFRPTDIGRDYIAGISTDADGLETINVYKLDRS